MALIMIVFGVLTILSLLAGFVVPKIRDMEKILPDHDRLEPAASHAVLNGSG
jgi:hypothetical protein